MSKKPARKKAAAKKKAAPKKPAAQKKPAAPKPPAQPSVEDLLARQNQLLEVIAKSTARLMPIADAENRKAGESRVVKDPHGLRKDVEALLTRMQMEETLLHETGADTA